MSTFHVPVPNIYGTRAWSSLLIYQHDWRDQSILVEIPVLRISRIVYAATYLQLIKFAYSVPVSRFV